MHIQSPFPGLSLSLPEAGPEIPVQEGDAVLLCQTLRRAADAVVVLIGADQQGGGESGKAVLRGKAGGLLQAAGVEFSKFASSEEFSVK